VNTLSQSPLISNRAYAVSQLQDLQAKLNKAKGTIASTRASVPSTSLKIQIEPAKPSAKRKDTQEDAPTIKIVKDETKNESALLKGVRDSTKLAMEAQHGLISQVLKDYIFGSNANLQDGLTVLKTAIVTDE